jgi:radical SAM protein with 4Fe4S-binding SPASM domain
MINKDFPLSFGELASVNAAWLTLTNFCNVHCTYCFNYMDKDHEFMSTRLVEKIIGNHHRAIQAAGVNVLNISYFGGEPTANPKALHIAIDTIAKMNIQGTQVLYTNGFMNEAMFQSLLGKGLHFQVSFDGFHQNLRLFKNDKDGLTAKTSQFIERLHQHGESITVRATIHEGNAPFMSELVAYLEDFPGIKLIFGPVCQFGEVLKYKIKQATVDDYLDNLIAANNRAERSGLFVDMRGKRYYEWWATQNRMMPLIWLPDGKIASSLTYASSKLEGADTIIIGKYDEETDEISMDENKIDLMYRNYIKNVQKYCEGCAIKDLCMGKIHFTPFATDTFVPERDYYFCEITRKSVERIP